MKEYQAPCPVTCMKYLSPWQERIKDKFVKLGPTLWWSSSIPWGTKSLPLLNVQAHARVPRLSIRRRLEEQPTRRIPSRGMRIFPHSNTVLFKIILLFFVTERSYGGVIDLGGLEKPYPLNRLYGSHHQDEPFSGWELWWWLPWNYRRFDGYQLFSLRCISWNGLVNESVGNDFS